MISVYQTLMSLCGVLTLVGIFLTWNLSRKIENFFLGHRRLSWYILFGGILTSLGFIATMFDVHRGIITIAILLGPVLIAYSLSESGLVRATWTMFLQVSIVAGSAIFVRESFYTVELASSVAILLLINAISGYVRTPEEYKRLAGISSWAFVVFIWLNIFAPEIAPAVYFFSISLWIYTLVRLHYVAAERLGNSTMRLLYSS
ncbi:hypothetical protein [Thermococcus alcaliphilus]|uniref:hypothetical protein n=1 Tax=Thermococcus alcaliphilus TaxID=139207 RepID=UPI0020906E1D|nr:hypothetical protein [Thermococcus alcaliphilus]MCO6042111.1 hypothetical protein [Thermococcus alcaliphilus]